MFSGLHTLHFEMVTEESGGVDFVKIVKSNLIRPHRLVILSGLSMIVNSSV